MGIGWDGNQDPFGEAKLQEKEKSLQIGCDLA